MKNVIYSFRTRGIFAEGVHVREIIKGLQRQGYNVLIVQPPGVNVLQQAATNDKEGTKSFKFWKTLSEKLPEICFEFMEIAYNLYAILKILIVSRGKKIEFIYERYAFFCFAGAIVSRITKIPLIEEVNEICEGDKPGDDRVRKATLIRGIKKIEKFIFKTASIILPVSEHLKEEIQKNQKEKHPQKIHVIENAVNEEEFVPQNNEALKRELGFDNNLTIGYVGIFVEWNKINLLLNVFKKLSDKFDYLKLLLVGDGPQREEYINFAERNNMAEKICILGPVSSNNVPKYISAMDVCVAPHVNEYRSPVKLFEYMAMGKISIAPNIPNVASVLRDGKNGFTFNLEDEKSLEDVLEKVINNFQSVEPLGEQAREDVISEHTWRKNAERIIKIYEALEKT